MTRTNRRTFTTNSRRQRNDVTHTTRASKSTRQELNYHLSVGMEYSRLRAARRTRKQISQNRTSRSFNKQVVVGEQQDLGSNRRRGENGCVEFSNVGSNILALNQLVRYRDPTQLVEETLRSCNSVGTITHRDIVTDLFVEIFATRNSRGGKGERMLSYLMWFAIKKEYPKTALQMIPLFVHYGYWKDLLQLCVMSKSEEKNNKDDLTMRKDESTTLNVCLSEMRNQLQKDIDAMKEYQDHLLTASPRSNPIERKQLLKDGPSISLLAKWLPREGSAFDRELNFVATFSKMVWPHIDPTSSGLKANYRKTVSKLTSYLELPEVLLSIQRADEINFHKLASKATMNLTRAILNETKSGSIRKPNDAKRIRLSEMFVEHMVKKGLKGAQVCPHEFVREILHNPKKSPMQEKALDAQWKAMVKSIVTSVKEKAAQEGWPFNPTQMVPLSDVSGSMTGVPMEVSIAMGILISEITHPAFQNVVLTFESKPRWHFLNPADSIVEKVKDLQRHRGVVLQTSQLPLLKY